MIVCETCIRSTDVTSSIDDAGVTTRDATKKTTTHAKTITTTNGVYDETGESFLTPHLK